MCLSIGEVKQTEEILKSQTSKVADGKSNYRTCIFSILLLDDPPYFLH